MSKDPAFLFYAADFLGGVADLTMEERGQYITLLCLQKIKGEINTNKCGLFLGCRWIDLSDDVRSKFLVDENGFAVNIRLRNEINKRSIFTEKQRSNGKKGGAPIGNLNAKKATKKQPKNNPKTNLLENENINENIDINKDSNKGIVKGGTEKYDWSIVPPEFIPVVEEWISYKTERKEDYAPQGFKSLITRLRRMSGENASAAKLITEQSMANNWAGLFELKQTTGNHGKSKTGNFTDRGSFGGDDD